MEVIYTSLWHNSVFYHWQTQDKVSTGVRCPHIFQYLVDARGKN